MASNYLTDDERMLRFVPWSKLRKDEDDNVLGVLPQAFEMRDNEEYLSVTWCEHFAGSADESLRCAIEAIRNSNLTVGAKAKFALALVGPVRLAADNDLGIKLRIIHEAEPDNAAHAAIRRWPRQENEFLTRIAEDEWASLIDAAGANDLPLTACAKSPRADD